VSEVHCENTEETEFELFLSFKGKKGSSDQNVWGLTFIMNLHSVFSVCSIVYFTLESFSFLNKLFCGTSVDQEHSLGYAVIIQSVHFIEAV
jgi:hypothetical protein